MNTSLQLSKPNQLTRTKADRVQLSVALAKVCALQKAYSKTPAELSTLVDGFLWVLGDIPVADIIQAIGEYCRTHADIPAPADILAIVDPPAPALSTAMYLEIKRRIADGNVWVGSAEHEYVRRFEAQELAKVG